MPGLVTQTKPPSLKRLQNLDNDFENLKSQLVELRDILRLPAHGLGEQVGAREHSRAQWAARWLFKKLQSTAPDGVEARSSPEAWGILRDVVAILPVSLTAQTLTAHSFVSCTERGLAELVAAQGAREVESAKLTLFDVTEHNDVPGSDASTESHGSSKRKRKGKEVTAGSAKKRKLGSVAATMTSNQHDKYRALFHAIMVCLQAQQGRLIRVDESQHPGSTELMRVALRADTQSAASILRHVCNALHVYLTNDPQGDHAPVLQGRLDAVIQLWNSRKPEPADRAAEKFSRTAMIPAMRLLHVLDARSSATMQGQSHERMKRTIRLLLARHVIIPSEQDYTASRQRLHTKQTSNVDDGESLLSTIFSPLQEQDNGKISGDSHAVIASNAERQDFLPLMYDVAIACSPMSSPKRKLAEMPWFQHLFAFLASISEDSATKMPDGYPVPREPLAVRAMLELCRKHGLKLQQETLRKLLEKEYLVHMRHHTECFRWDITAAVMALDPEVLLPTKLNTSKAPNDDDSVLHNIYKEATTVAWRTSMPVGEATGYTRNDGVYSAVKSGFVIPFLHAYVSARALPQFLSMWCERLIDAESFSPTLYTNDHARGIPVSVWEDAEVLAAISDNIETSLTTDQIVEVIQAIIARSAKEASNDIGQVGSTDCIALNAILGGLRSADVIQRLSPTTQNLIERCCIITVDEKLEPRKRTSAWRLLSTSYALFISLADVSSTSNTNSVDPDNVLRSMSLGGVPDLVIARIEGGRKANSAFAIAEAIEAVACLGSLAIGSRRRHLQLREMKDNQVIVSSLKHCLEDDIAASDTTKVSWIDTCLLPVLMQYPSLWLGIGDTITQEAMSYGVFGSLLRVANAGSAYQGRRPEVLVENDPLKTPSAIRALNTQVLDYSEVAMQSQGLHRFDDGSGQNNEFLTLLVQIAGDPEEKNERSQALAQSVILQVPLVHLPLEGRDKITTKVMSRLQGKEVLDADTVHRYLSLMFHVLPDEPTSTSWWNQWERIWELAKSLDTHGLREKSIWPRCRDVFESVLERVLDNNASHAHNAQSVQDVLEQYHISSSSEMEADGQSSRSITRSPATLAVIKHQLRQSICNDQDTQATTDDSSELRSAVFQTLRAAIDATKTTCPGDVLETLAFCGASVFKDHETWFGKLINDTNRLSNISTSRERAALCKLQCSLDVARGTFTGVRTITAFLSDSESAQNASMTRSELQIILSNIAASMQVLTQNQRLEILKATLSALDDPLSDTGALRVVHYLTMSFTDWAQHDDISPIITTISQHMAHESSTHRHKLLSETALALLQLKNAHASQHAVETLVAALTTLLSPNSPNLLATHARQIYSLLIKITHSLLARSAHRTHLRGRFHLLIPLLQALLRTLFVPNHPHSPTPAIPRPSWLQKAGTNPLRSRHAAALSRVLLLLTDPTPSSVTTHHKGSNLGKAALTDATVAARTTAAHFAPLLIAELAQCMLRGRFCADGVREALMPGVRGLIGVVVMKGEKDGVGSAVLGMGLGSGSREVVRGLVAEWRRAGGGDRRA